MDIISKTTLGEHTFLKKNRYLQTSDLTFEEKNSSGDDFCTYEKHAKLDIGIDEPFTFRVYRHVSIKYQGCKTQEQKDAKRARVAQEFLEKVEASQESINNKLVLAIEDKLNRMIELNNGEVLSKYENAVRGMDLDKLSKYCEVKPSELLAEKESSEISEQIRELSKKMKELDKIVFECKKRGFNQYVSEKFGASQEELKDYFKPSSGRLLY
jgi:hypothetical protein